MTAKAAYSVVIGALAGFGGIGEALAADPEASAAATITDTLRALEPRAQAPSSFKVLPGASRAISHAASASRDTAALGLIVLPRVVVTGGADIALFAIEGSGLTFRPGFFGMLELESKDETERFLPRAGEEVSLWRGLYGYSAAISFDRAARSALGEGGAIEAAVSYRHESEHFTGSNAGAPAENFTSLPQMGDFIMVDLGLRAPFGRLSIETRAQYKAFVVHGDEIAPYRHAAGADLIFKYRAFSAIHFFSSTFAEFLIASTPAEDAFFFRNLTGAVVPGRVGDLYVFAAADVGHGKGFLVRQRTASLGGGLRLALE